MIAKNYYPKTALLTPYIVILGTAQDGGYPQAGCNEECCRESWINPSLKRLVTSIAIVDPITKDRWLFDITPDFIEQFHILEELSPVLDKKILSGIFLTHGHVGHYIGLTNLGREAMNTNKVNVYAMPLMLKFLKKNNPWYQLIKLDNVKLNLIKNRVSITLNKRVSIIPFLVSHRDELTETVGFEIIGPKKTAVFIPDVDSWNKNVIKIINTSDIALIDGTFYDKDELPVRDMREFRHPFITESMNLFEKHTRNNTIYFIHFNHTNPAKDLNSSAYRVVKKSRFKIAMDKQIIEL